MTTATSDSDPDSDPAADTHPGVDEPTDRERIDAWLALADDETVRWHGRPRIQTVVPWLAVAVLGMAGIAVAVAVGWLSPLALGWLPVLSALPLWRYVRVARTAFVITDRRVAIRRGVLGVSVRAVALERTQNTTVTQGAIETVIDAGTVAVETASGSTLAFRSIDDPLVVRRVLERAATGDAVGEIPGTRAQWEAVRDEVRNWRVTIEDATDPCEDR
ncbi:PH domain-containing protein [Natronococcus occultus]|uniref:Putative membrane protein n=1 Tax=Natronococcus occultus SP4 TaxID=694430 RepID=L0JYB5_9EURY|nr:PH domain-containing protein [Natronococcus occultus]AGB36828.1 putative membrane protein [Natronococcus occultus SP4]